MTLTLIMRIQMKRLRCVSCYFAQSMNFMHMVILLDTVSRDIKCVLYVNLMHVFTNFNFGKKTVYLGHRKFLNPNHPFHRLQNTFNGEKEFDISPKNLTKDEAYQ